MSDKNLTVAEGEAIIHDGRILREGDSFKLPEDAAQTLLDEGKVEEGKGSKKAAKSTEPEKPAEETGETPAEETAEESKVPEGDAKTLIANVSSYSDEELAAIAAQEDDASKPRQTVIDAVEAEQKSRES